MLALLMGVVILSTSLPVFAAPPTEQGGGTTEGGNNSNGNGNTTTTPEGNNNGSNTNTGGGNKLSQEEQQKLLDSINKSMGKNVKLEQVLSVHKALVTSGVSDYCSSAIIVNGMRESSLNPECAEKGGTGIGIWQWSFKRRDGLQKFCQEMNDQQYTVKGYKIGGLATQTAYLVKELKSNQWMDKPPKKYYYNVDYKKAQSLCMDKNFDFGKSMSSEEWFACKEPVAAALYFTSCFERCKYSIDILKKGALQCPDMYKLLSGSGLTSGGTDAKLDKELGTAMVKAGLWDETQFVAWKEAVDTTLEFNDIMDLKEGNIADVEIWKQDIEHQRGGTFLIKLGRWLCLIFGILLEIWMMLLYLSYWFDRINNFVEVELLKVVSFGRLTISPDESECTFRVKDAGEGKVRTVNHRTILVICLVGLFFGTFTVSGGLFKTLNKFVTFILSLLN